MALKRRIDPPRTNAKLHIDQAWHRLQDFFESQLNNVGFTGVLWVDQTDGDNDTAIRGSLTFKYATVQAALDAATDGDTVWVSPGLYVEDIDWPDTDNLTLRGMGVLSTGIINATARDTINIVPTIVLGGAEISNLSITNSAADRALNVVGSADPDMFASRVLYLHDLVFGDNVRIEVVNEIDFRNIEAKDAALLLLNTSRTNMRGARWDAITATYENAPAVAPTNGRLAFAADSTIVDNALTVNSLASVVFGEDTQVGSVVGLLTDVVAGTAGAVWMSGRVVGTVGISFNYDDTYHECCRFDYAQIGAAVTVAGTGAQRGHAKFRHAELLDTTGPHTAGAVTDIDLRGALFAQASIAVAADGTVDRSVWQFTGATAQGAGDYAEVIFGGTGVDPGAAIPYPIGTTNYQVFVESDILGDLPVKIDTKVAASFHRTKTADVGPCVYTIIRPFD